MLRMLSQLLGKKVKDYIKTTVTNIYIHVLFKLVLSGSGMLTLVCLKIYLKQAMPTGYKFFSGSISLNLFLLKVT